ncbi:MAG: hypothetical protein LKJ90_02410 [Faecalibacterium sp.]|jgi:hypothetical protein|nr:hypothetical protein [Faecalibacterium sp.]
MKHHLRAAAALAAAVFSVSVLAACGSTAASSAKQETLLGKVTAVNDTSLTIALVEESAQAAPGDGKAPEKPDAVSGATSEAVDGTAGATSEQKGADGKDDDDKEDNEKADDEKDDLDEDHEKPDTVSGAMPDSGAVTEANPPQQGGAPGMGDYSETGESRTLTLSAKTTVSAQGSAESAAASELTVGSIVEVTAQGDTATAIVIRGNATGAAQPGGESTTQDNGTAATTYDSDASLSGESYHSDAADENAVRATGGANVTLTKATVRKTGDTSSQDRSNFYGMNAGALAEEGATLNLSGADVTTNASGANGVFAYGTGVVNVSDTKIRTTKDNSGGIEVAGGGTLYATNLDVQTEGKSAAAIRSDRGGGTETVEDGIYITNGTGSPSVYSTANVSVSNATLTANHSEAVVVEGKNSVSLQNCTVSGAMDGTYGTDSENIHGVMLYQSMSGDADEGQAQFSMEKGSLTAENGDLFYITNTNCVINLNAVALHYDTTCNLLTVAGNDGANGWGTAGKNGGQAQVNCTAQTLAGKLAVDEASTLNLTLSGASSLTGSVNSENSGASAVAVTLDDTSTWTLTDDCYLTEFNGSTACITANGHHVYVNGSAIV